MLLAVGSLMVSLAGNASASEPGKQVSAAPAGAPVVSSLDTAASAITDRAQRAGVGYAGLVVDEKNDAITLFAKEQAAAQSLVAVTPAAAGAKVDVRRAEHSQAELRDAAEKLWKSAPEWKKSGVEVYGISVRPDGGGLTVRASDVAAVAAVATGAAQVPLTFEKGAEVVPTSRYDDAPPHAGGIHLARGGGSHCSSAFAVRQWNNTYLMTAAHCYQNGVGDGPVTTGGGGHYIGRVSGWDASRDAASVQTNAWSGVWVNDSSWTHYRDAAWSYNGNEVCQSGVATSQTCGIYVVNQNDSWNFGMGTVWGVTACAPSGFTAVRPGDSGGPVYDWYADGKVRSRGVISAGSQPTGAGYRCVHFAETLSILNKWSAGTAPVTLVTSP
ncbi:hypothetical protein FKR81_17010 [Lentzea tibetensis]|uniref:Uncharacterized protein n=1 Tax=Lentzea tibetensis TaxID=2591470 RepID=A0A563EU99_9PSEU|nr:hypothetical protein [Lentzea tibetensis]TWP51307.1 hypothetical protein FKR81_17010 [Lentzea tibetensis]